MRKVTKIEDENLDTVGKRITYLRTNAGMSQEELAEKLNIKRQKLSYIENDAPSRQLTIEELSKLCNIFNVSSDYILGMTNAKNIDNVVISKEFGFDDETINCLKKMKNSMLVKHTLNFLLKEEELICLFAKYFCSSTLSDMLIENYSTLAIKMSVPLFESKYCYAEIIETLPKIFLKTKNELQRNTNYLYEYMYEFIEEENEYKKQLNNSIENDISDEELTKEYNQKIDNCLSFINSTKKYFIDNNLSGTDYLTQLENSLILRKTTISEG